MDARGGCGHNESSSNETVMMPSAGNFPARARLCRAPLLRTAVGSWRSAVSRLAVPTREREEEEEEEEAEEEEEKERSSETGR